MQNMLIGSAPPLLPAEKLEDKNKKLFKLNTFEAFIQCFSLVAEFLRNGTEVHIQILSKDRYKFHIMRTAYFTYLGEVLTRADHDGRTVGQMHKDYKLEFLFPILSRDYEWFADLVKASVGEDIHSRNVEKAVNKLVSIADGSIVTTAQLREFFKKVEMDIENREFKTVGGE